MATISLRQSKVHGHSQRLLLAEPEPAERPDTGAPALAG